MSTDVQPRAAASNAAIATELGLTHAMVSRLRSGKRNPSVQTIGKVCAVFKWAQEAQVTAMNDGTYAVEFEKILIARFGSEEESTNE